MTIRYTIAMDGIEALENFRDSRCKFVADSISQLIEIAAREGAHRGWRTGAYSNYRIYKGTLTTGGARVQHYVWTDAAIPSDAKSITFDAVPVGATYPPHKTIWEKGFDSAEACLSDDINHIADSMIKEWKVFPVVGILEFPPDKWEISEVN